MATTSPDSIRTPSPTDPYNLVADWAITASDTQAALVKRANLYVGTSAQRTAFTTAPEGVHWQDTNGTTLEYVRKSGVWRPAFPIASGNVTFTSVAASTDYNQSVTFPAGMFTSAPNVTLALGSGAAWNTTVNMWVSGAVTTSGFTLGFNRSVASASQRVFWMAA